MICRDIFTSNITQTKTLNVDETQEIASLMDLDDLSNFWARFQISFSWDYPDGFDVQAVQSAVFHVVGDAETRAQDQLVVGCVQSAGAGVTLTRPLPEVDMVPCEMSFTAHPMAQEFCIRNIVIVSEARNVELYIDDNYEKTARGIMLTIKKGRKVSLFETEFDLTEFIHGTCRCLLKFLSYPEEHSMRLQTIVVRVARLPSNPAFPLQGARPGQVDLTNVRSYLDSLGKPLTPEAQKLLESMEQMQTVRGTDRLRSQSVGSQPRLEGLGTSTFSGSETSILMQAMSRAKQLEEEEKNERLNRNLPSSPENDEGFINMLAGLMADKSPETAEERTHVENGVDAPESPTLAKHRWETYLSSRVRASRNMVRKSRPVSLGSAFPPQTRAVLSPRAQSFCLEDKRAVEKVITEQTPVPLEKAESDGSDSGSASRCATCGCPGCLSVYNSITTNIYAVEKRIMGRVEAKLQSLVEHIDSRLDAISNSLLLRQEQVIAQGLAINGIPARKFSQRNGHKPGDSSV